MNIKTICEKYYCKNLDELDVFIKTLIDVINCQVKVKV